MTREPALSVSLRLTAPPRGEPRGQHHRETV
nr:MAG TPA: hypothetical protein [Caudoviricetes sp.]